MSLLNKDITFKCQIQMSQGFNYRIMRKINWGIKLIPMRLGTSTSGFSKMILFNNYFKNIAQQLKRAVLPSGASF
jgi:hypothetical protein